jgi:hypothetical protein
MRFFLFRVNRGSHLILRGVRGVRILLGLMTASFYLWAAPTFYRDVLPILQKRCQECHRAGEIGHMPLVTFRDTRPWAKAIREAVRAGKMPPWFADPCCGKFANDRTLTRTEIDTLANWADSGAMPGDARDAPHPRTWPMGGNLASPDAVLEMPRPFAVPAKGAVEYQRFVIRTGFDGDRWVQAVEVRPGARAVVHHVVVYIREPGETWVEGATKSDLLTVYAPGGTPEVWPEGMAKLIPKGADLVMELHYTPNGKAVSDRTKVAIKFAATAPHKRVLTLQMQPERLVIPPGEANAHVTVSGTLPNDALLLGFFPHMHLRGKAFEYDRILPDGRPEVMLRVSHYDFHWQMDYRLAEPIALKRGTRLAWTAWYDNSANNPLNPDPSAEVHWGEQSWEEMMVGFFYVAVDPTVDRAGFFVRMSH